MLMGRVFCRRLAAATAGVKAPHHYLRLSKDYRDDLRVWEMFLGTFNGRSMWLETPVSNCDLELYTDAAGSGGFAAYFWGQWSAGEWPDSWRGSEFIRNLVLLELFPIVLADELWGQDFRNKWV